MGVLVRGGRWGLVVSWLAAVSAVLYGAYSYVLSYVRCAMRPMFLRSSATVAVSPQDTSTTTAWHATSVEATRTVVIIVGNMLTDDVLMGRERRHGHGRPLATPSCSPSDARSGPDRGCRRSICLSELESVIT